jgi:hypothetical protein
MKMKRLATSLAVMALIVGSGAIVSARADDDRESALFTPRLHGDHFVCSAINISDKTLGIKIVILDDNGQLVVPSSGDPNPTGNVKIAPGAEAEINFFFASVGDGYCEVEVSGTGNRDDVRVEMDVHWTRVITDPVTGTSFEHLQDLAVQGY